MQCSFREKLTTTCTGLDGFERNLLFPAGIWPHFRSIVNFPWPSDTFSRNRTRFVLVLGTERETAQRHLTVTDDMYLSSSFFWGLE